MHSQDTAQSTQRRIDTTEPTSRPQTAQIIENLRQRKRQLETRESEFRLQVFNWETAAAAQQTTLDQRQTELDKKEQRLRELQFQMLELQNQLIESQLALESIVAQVEQPVSPNDQIAGLEQLRSELFDRFDVVEGRWGQMVEELREVAGQITDAVQATNKIELD